MFTVENSFFSKLPNGSFNDEIYWNHFHVKTFTSYPDPVSKWFDSLLCLSLDLYLDFTPFSVLQLVRNGCVVYSGVKRPASQLDWNIYPPTKRLKKINWWEIDKEEELKKLDRIVVKRWRDSRFMIRFTPKY